LLCCIAWFTDAGGPLFPFLIKGDVTKFGLPLLANDRLKGCPLVFNDMFKLLFEWNYGLGP